MNLSSRAAPHLDAATKRDASKLHVRVVQRHLRLDDRFRIWHSRCLRGAHGRVCASLTLVEGVAMVTEQNAWYVNFFGEDYLNIYRHIFTPERTQKEVAFAERRLGLTTGVRVLDLCCGPGRHSVRLVQRGYKVTGLDLSPSYLDLARRAAADHNVALDTVSADMREIPFDNYFDAVINMYSSFGYLESEAEDLKVLESIVRSLKPGGRLLLDMLNREWAVANYIQNDWHAGEDGTLYIERRALDLMSSRMRVRFVIVGPNGDRRDSMGHDIRLYTLTEMTRLLERVGFDQVEVFGGFDDEPYEIGTRRMVICARNGAELAGPQA
jgi:SAM-dependent methyltransferase